MRSISILCHLANLFREDVEMAITRRAVLIGASALQAVGAPATVRLPHKVRVAIVGFEGHSDEILAPLPQLPDVEITAICDPDPAELERQRRHPALARATAYPKSGEMFAREKLDLVAVCNNDGERAAAILDCLAHGTHVIAEKPLALRKEDLRSIQAASKRSGKQVGILLPLRFEPAFLQMRKAVESGIIGEVGIIDAQKSYKAGARAEWYRHRSTYGGTIPWVGIHMIDLMHFVGGREFRDVWAVAANVSAPQLGEMENSAAALFRLDNGGAATLRLDYFRPESAASHGDDRLRIAGTKGVLEYRQETGVIFLGDAQAKLPPLPEAQSVFVDFLEKVYLGKPSTLSDAEIFRVNEITLGAQEAADSRRIVSL